jgi:hypothetical protein
MRRDNELLRAASKGIPLQHRQALPEQRGGFDGEEHEANAGPSTCYQTRQTVRSSLYYHLPVMARMPL